MRRDPARLETSVRRLLDAIKWTKLGKLPLPNRGRLVNLLLLKLIRVTLGSSRGRFSRPLTSELLDKSNVKSLFKFANYVGEDTKIGKLVKVMPKMRIKRKVMQTGW